MFQKTYGTNEKVFPQGFISALMETLYLIYQDSEEFLECQIPFFSKLYTRFGVTWLLKGTWKETKDVSR